MVILYPVLGVIMMGGFFVSLVIGTLGLIDIISGTANHYLSYGGWCYKEVDINQFEDLKENSDLFLRYSKGKLVGIYKYWE